MPRVTIDGKVHELPEAVVFTDLRVMHDMDLFGAGEIYLRFDVNRRGVIVGPIALHGDQDGGRGDRVADPVVLNPPVVVSVKDGDTEVRIRVFARDDDAIGRANNPFKNPKAYDDLGTNEIVFGPEENFGRGTTSFLSNDNFAVSYRIV
jgi:hypothetical protein